MTESGKVRVKVLFFAKARELSGKTESTILVEPVTSYSRVLDRIVSEFSLGLIKSSVILAVNQAYASADQTLELKAGDEIAVIPPLSGGRAVKRYPMDTVKLLSTKISIEEVADIVGSPSCGATSLFIGTTRDNFDNKKVVQLEYEAYESMAETAMKKICSDIRGKWEVQNIAIVHRYYKKDSEEVSTPGKKRKKRSQEGKSLDTVDDFTVNAIRNAIYRMYAEGDTILKEIRERQIDYYGGRSSLHKLLKKMGFSWTTVDGRKALIENENIVLQRIDFLRKYKEEKERGANFIFVDETWIFQRGTVSKSWQDKSLQSAKRRTVGDGKRFIVVNAGGRTGFVPGAGLLFVSDLVSSRSKKQVSSLLCRPHTEQNLLKQFSLPLTLSSHLFRYGRRRFTKGIQDSGNPIRSVLGRNSSTTYSEISLQPNRKIPQCWYLITLSNVKQILKGDTMV